MARRLKTSRTQVARFLDPENCSVQSALAFYGMIPEYVARYALIGFSIGILRKAIGADLA